MARTPRSFTVRAGFASHKVWRGHKKEDNLGTAEQKETYLEFMNEDIESDKYEVGYVLEALTLMDNHTHELPLVSNPKLYSHHMRRHHARYGRYFNDVKNRCGKVAQDRPHTTLIADKDYRVRCTLYIHANPHRGGISDPDRYEYSTHKLYAYGKRSAWMRNIKLPRWYLNLGKNPAERQRNYRRLFAKYLALEGSTKQKFLRGLFFGPPQWVMQNEDKVSAWRKERALAAAAPD